MLDRISDFFALLCVKAQIEMNKLKNEEDGLETLETVILIGIAVIIAVVLLNLLTGSGHDGKDGLISKIFKAIGNQL